MARCGSCRSTASLGSAPARWATTPSDLSVELIGRREQLLADRALTGSAFCQAHTELIESWLVGLLGDEPGVCLVSVGGMGRRELCPYSDVDLVLLHAGRKDVGEVAERLWYPIWDSGLSLDHSVRTVKQALAVADDDLKAALGLLDARPIAGDASLADGLVAKGREQWRRRAKRALPELLAAVDARAQRFGEVAFLLEPDLKEGRGGLRDVHARRAAALAAPVVDAAGGALAGPNEVLLAARVELHRRAGRAADRLLLQEQDAVAAALACSDADALMRAVSLAARTIAFETDDALRRVRSWLAGPRGRRAGGDRPLGPGLALRDGDVVLTADANPAGDRSLILRAAAAAAIAGAPLGTAAVDTLAASAAPPGDPWPDEARHALVALLGSGPALVPVVEMLDQRGLLVRVLPEWTAVRSRPQRNAYHRFTVDRHLCETAVEASALTRQVSRPDLLVVGAWLHDLGKGYPGDHTVAGVALMGRIAPRMGFDAADVDVLVKLVRDHLLLADAATRRDLSDEATITAVAQAVGDQSTLELLAALTEADSKATGSTAWSPWKAELVHELVARTAAFLADGGSDGAEREVIAHPAVERARATLAAGAAVHVETSWPELVVAARDRAGLFADVAGTLALHGLSVLAADAWTSDDGVAVESFRTESTFGREPERHALEADLAAAVEGVLPVEARLAERVRTYAGRRTAVARRAAPRVLVDNDASARATLVEVRAPDGIAVLYRITRALAALDLDVHYAKVATLGAEVVDAFYVVEKSAGKVGVGRRQEVQRAVLTALAQLTAFSP
jgi:[protein-PII] uridylyltransferase